MQGTGPSGAATLGSHCSALRTTTFFRVECPLPRGAGTGHASRVQRRTRLHATPAHTAARMEGGVGQSELSVHTFQLVAERDVSRRRSIRACAYPARTPHTLRAHTLDSISLG